MTTRSSRLLRRSLAVALLCQAACAGVRGPYVWVDDLDGFMTAVRKLGLGSRRNVNVPRQLKEISGL